MAPRLPIVCFALVAVVLCSDVGAQFYSRGGDGSVFVRAPFVRVNVTPEGVRVGAPGVQVNSPRNRYYLPPQQASAFAPAAPTPHLVPSPIARLTEVELATLADAALLAELTKRSQELDTELAGLTGGQGWRSYLALPASVHSGAMDVKRTTQLLDRYDLVARDQRYVVISSLAAFEPTRMALRVAIDRERTRPVEPAAVRAPALQSPHTPVLISPNGPVLKSPNAETLPAPAASTPAGERSVLKL